MPNKTRTPKLYFATILDKEHQRTPLTVRVCFGNWIFPLWMGKNKQKKTGSFDFRFEAQNQQLNYSAFFFHFHFLITLYKMKFKVYRNEKTDQKQALFIFSHRKSDRSAWSGTIKDSLMTMTAGARMDQYILFRKNKRVCLRDEDMTILKLSRIFQVGKKIRLLLAYYH